MVQGNLVNSKTFNTISQPVGICQAKSKRLTVLKAMWRLRAVSFPFCMGGTRAAARAHSTVIPAKKAHPNTFQKCLLRWCEHFMRYKIDNSYLVTFLCQTPIFEWYVGRCGSKNGYQKDVCSKEIELHAQNMIIVLDWIVNTIREDLDDHVMSTRISTFIINKLWKLWAKWLLPQ